MDLISEATDGLQHFFSSVSPVYPLKKVSFVLPVFVQKNKDHKAQKQKKTQKHSKKQHQKTKRPITTWPLLAPRRCRGGLSPRGTFEGPRLQGALGAVGDLAEGGRRRVWGVFLLLFGVVLRKEEEKEGFGEVFWRALGVVRGLLHF